MRAVAVRRFGPAESLALSDLPDPVPGPGELVVSVGAAPVNLMSLLMMDGSYQSIPERPFVPGKGPAGEGEGFTED